MAQHMAQQNAEGSRDLSTLVDASTELQHLVQTIWRLRQPDGCPWDREQTFDSLRSNTIEETYELADAITDHNMEGIKEELGDLLLHVVFYSKLGEEAKVAVRNIRRDAMDKFKAQKKKSEITEDDLKIIEKDLQKLTDDYIKEVERIADEKEKELMEI